MQHRASMLPAALLAGLVLQVGSAVALDNDFSAYPEGSQQCLSDSADSSGCSGSTGHELNTCLCSNQGNFVYDSAKCIGKKDSSDLESVYDTMQNNCQGTGNTLSVSKSAFMSAGNSAATTSTTSSAKPTKTADKTSSSSGSNPTSDPTESPSSTSTSDSDSDSTDSSDTSDGLSTGAKIGLGVGIGFGVVAAALAGWFIWAYARRRKSTPASGPEEGGDFEGKQGSNIPPTSPPAEYAQYNSQFGAAELPPTAAAGYSYYQGDGPGGYKKVDTQLPAAELGEANYARPISELPADTSTLAPSYVSPMSGGTSPGQQSAVPSQMSTEYTGPHTPSYNYRS